jgi:hypothetical protein
MFPARLRLHYNRGFKRGTVGMIRQVVFAFAVSLTALSALHAEDRPTQPTGATFDADTSVLTLTYAEGKPREFKLKPTSRRYQHFRIGDDLLRYYSPAYYAKLGAEPIGRVIFTPASSPKDIHFDTVNAVARKFPVAKAPTADDVGMLATITLIRRHNRVGRRPLCRQEKAAELMPGILAETCYVVCGGLSAIVSQTSQRPSRVVSLEARIDQLSSQHEFHWSEGHTLVEIEGEAGWYAADPTFGYVYVKDARGAAERPGAAAVIGTRSGRQRPDLRAGLPRQHSGRAGQGGGRGEPCDRFGLLHARQTAHRL